MKQLKDILYKVSLEQVEGTTDRSIAAISFDTRDIDKDDVFVAIRGAAADGHQYIEKAIKQGANTVICESLPTSIEKNITYIKVDDTKQALAVMAANYYGNPSEQLKLVGVTGTNGKTTVSTLLYNLFEKSEHKAGLISTVTIIIDKKHYPTKLTTPDSLTINRYLRMMVDRGVEYCFMEASSHGIDQKRTAGLAFNGGIFTNLSHDHLDYHNSFAEYRDVKKSFFDQLPKTAFALSNSDDKNGVYMLQNTQANKKFYALKTDAEYKAKILENGFQGMLLRIGNREVWTKLIGNFNAYNILAIYAAADLLGIETLSNLKYISELKAVEGRFEYFVSEHQKITAVVDYAHTPDALENVLKTINTIRTHNEKLITVVGCGGDRDATKRPEMGQIATELSTKIILTSDNPRTEDPELIINDIEKGVAPQNAHKTVSITDRKQAIKTACTMAENNDIILIAGKGHENYQEINGKRHHFDDMELVVEFLKTMNK